MYIYFRVKLFSCKNFFVGTLDPQKNFYTKIVYTKIPDLWYISCSGLLRVLFCAVYNYSSMLESDIIALSLGHNGDQCSCENRTRTELSSCCTYTWLTIIIDWVGPGLNLRHSFYLLKDAIINPWPLNGTGFYSRKYSTLHVKHGDK